MRIPISSFAVRSDDIDPLVYVVPCDDGNELKSSIEFRLGRRCSILRGC